MYQQHSSTQQPSSFKLPSKKSNELEMENAKGQRLQKHKMENFPGIIIMDRVYEHMTKETQLTYVYIEYRSLQELAAIGNSSRALVIISIIS